MSAAASNSWQTGPSRINPALIALGSNLGDRLANLRMGFDGLAALPGTTLLAVALPIETDPVGPPGQGSYLNAAATIATTLPAAALLGGLLSIERAAGRDRTATEPWGPRTLDLDLLLYADLVVSEPGLTVPHPLMHQRDFVLRPASAVAADWEHPLFRRPIAALLAQLEADRP